VQFSFEPAAEADVCEHDFIRNAKALLSPHECGGSHPKIELRSQRHERFSVGASCFSRGKPDFSPTKKHPP
jgi:hypothetical protein